MKKYKPILYVHELPPQWREWLPRMIAENLAAGMDKAASEKKAEKELLRSWVCQQALRRIEERPTQKLFE